MSDIRANTISDTSGNGPINLHKQIAAKAWVNFNGTGVLAVRESANVSSMTDISVGGYEMNFSNSMSSADYSAQVTTGRVAAITGDNQGLVQDNTVIPTSSDFRIRTAGENFSGQDVARIYSIVHGVLA